MNEFIDPKRGRMLAIPEADGCIGCAYYQDDDGCPSVIRGMALCFSGQREDRRNIIWVRAESAPQQPKAVRLTDE